MEVFEILRECAHNDTLDWDGVGRLADKYESFDRMVGGLDLWIGENALCDEYQVKFSQRCAELTSYTQRHAQDTDPVPAITQRVTQGFGYFVVQILGAEGFDDFSDGNTKHFVVIRKGLEEWRTSMKQSGRDQWKASQKEFILPPSRDQVNFQLEFLRQHVEPSEEDKRRKSMASRVSTTRASSSRPTAHARRTTMALPESYPGAARANPPRAASATRRKTAAGVDVVPSIAKGARATVSGRTALGLDSTGPKTTTEKLGALTVNFNETMPGEWHRRRQRMVDPVAHEPCDDGFIDFQFIYCIDQMHGDVGWLYSDA